MTAKFPSVALLHTQDDYIDGIRSAAKWDLATGGINLTFSFPATGDFHPGQPILATLLPGNNTISNQGINYTNQTKTFPTFTHIPLTFIPPSTATGTSMGGDHITVVGGHITDIDNDSGGNGELYKGDKANIAPADATAGGLGSGSGFEYTFGDVDYGNQITRAANYLQASSMQQTLIPQILAMVAQIGNITFSPTTETRNNHGVLRWARTITAAGNLGTATAFTSTIQAPGAQFSITNGDTFSYTGSSGTGGNLDGTPTRGSYSYMAHMHEQWHGLGAKHPHETDGVMPKMATTHNGLGPADPLDQDCQSNTIMSYRAFIGAGVGGLGIANGSYLTGPGARDVQLIILNYGHSLTPRVVSVLSWDNATGEEQLDGVGQGATVGSKIHQSWHGKVDKIYAANFSGVTIDLTPGAWWTVSAAMKADLGGGHVPPGNVQTPYDTDPLYQVRVIEVGPGTNTLVGAPNRDNTFICANGTDTINGSAGNNTVALPGNAADYSPAGTTTVVLTDLRGIGGGTKTLTNIQFIQFADGTRAITNLGQQKPVLPPLFMLRH